MSIQELQKKIEKSGFIDATDLSKTVVQTLVGMGYKYFHCGNVKVTSEGYVRTIKAVGKAEYDWDACYDWYVKKVVPTIVA